MYTTKSFPVRTYHWEQPQVSDNSIAERVEAFKRSNGRPKQNIKTASPDPLPSSRTRPFPWAQDEVPDITIFMRNEKFKWWNAPPKTDQKSKAEAAKSGKFELHVPSVEALKIDAPFLPPSSDSLRSFRDNLHPLAQTKEQSDAMSMRDEKFKQYKGQATKPGKPVTSYESQYLDHNTQGAKPGAWQPHTVSIENQSAFLDFLQDLHNWIGNWIGYLMIVLVLAFLFFSMDPLIKPVLTFLFRRGVVPSLLFICFLLFLIR
ncbi:hypothetical protein N431DRAFT_504030 [Stipitochalara longipes BDJ]|nr:hypothetical protein N431DRAFT_504030 [Stipitochalara longipes BDJ]